MQKCISCFNSFPFLDFQWQTSSAAVSQGVSAGRGFKDVGLKVMASASKFGDDSHTLPNGIGNDPVHSTSSTVTLGYANSQVMTSGSKFGNDSSILLHVDGANSWMEEYYEWIHDNNSHSHAHTIRDFFGDFFSLWAK